MSTGKLTREQLSQLLLAYMAMAADGIELFECFKEDTVTNNKELIYAILGELQCVCLTIFYSMGHLPERIVFNQDVSISV